jgi:hypothetical protein
MQVLQAYGEATREVAAGLKQALQHMGAWSVLDLTLGVRYVGQRHDVHGVCDNLAGTQLSPSADAALFQTLRAEMRIARAAYAIPDADAIAQQAQGLIDAAALARVHPAAARFKPAHFVAVDAAAALVRVVVRGTKDTADVLTDIAGHWEPYEGGQVHSGFLQSAKWLLAEEAELLAELLRKHRGCAAALLRPCVLQLSSSQGLICTNGTSNELSGMINLIYAGYRVGMSSFRRVQRSQVIFPGSFVSSGGRG